MVLFCNKPVIANEYSITSLRFCYIANVYGVIYVFMETLSEAVNEITYVHLLLITNLNEIT